MYWTVAQKARLCQQRCAYPTFPTSISVLLMFEMVNECFSRIQIAVRKQTRLVRGQDPVETIFVPYFHFSAHGNEGGLGLTSGEFLSWKQLKELLVKFARNTTYISSTDVGLFSVTFSACKGANAQKMFSASGAQPCTAIVGPTHNVSWADSLTAFVTFYHQ